jgi:hypothetical protein
VKKLTKKLSKTASKSNCMRGNMPSTCHDAVCGRGLTCGVTRAMPPPPPPPTQCCRPRVRKGR